MRVLSSGEADTTAVAVLEGRPLDDPALQAYVERGEARATQGHVAVAHEGGRRWLLVGMGADPDSAAAREAAKAAHARAEQLGTRSLRWEAPAPELAPSLVEGTILACYRFTRFKPREDRALEALVVADHDDVCDAAILARAQNHARELQDRPANDLTPEALGHEAVSLAGHVGALAAEVRSCRWITKKRMGALLGVACGSAYEPQLIELHWEPDGVDASTPVLGLVGKAVTYDSGGLQIKPGASMGDMKHDMAGGAVVMGAMEAIARLHLPVRVVAIIGACENVIGPSAMRPGDVLHAMDGTTIEVTNTDAEGRLVLADCIAYARELGVGRIVDVASLTGGIVTALGSTYGGLFTNDDAWADAVIAAGDTAGEPVWRLPLHPDYRKLVAGKITDLVNSGEPRTRAHAAQGASFLHHFAGDRTPWAHLDIAGVSKTEGGATGFGVRLLTELARSMAPV
jgi:leucyl aminopeptidase